MLLHCDQCEAVVDAEEMHDYVFTETSPKNPFWDLRYVFLRCPVCSNPFLVEQNGDCTCDPLHPSWDEPGNVLYPAPFKRVDPKLPLAIRRAFEEALKCLRCGAYVACAIMCRKTLEALCTAHKMQQRTLAASLTAMRDQDIIDGRLHEWADGLRLVGNEAAHDVGVLVSRLDAEDQIDFAHAVLEYTFTFRDKFQAFKDRRQQAKEKRSKDEEETPS